MMTGAKRSGSFLKASLLSIAWTVGLLLTARSDAQEQVRAQFGAPSVPAQVGARLIKGFGPVKEAPVVDAGEFYRASGRVIRLFRSLDKVAVRTANPAQIRGQLRVAVGTDFDRDETPRPDLHILKASQRLTQASLNAALAVAGVDPVYINEQTGSEMVVTDQFVVRLVPDAKRAALDALNAVHGAVVVSPIHGSDREFVCRRPRTTATEILSLCEVYHQDQSIAWASPDFVFKLRLQYTPSDPLYPDQWHLSNTEQTDAAPDADVDAPEAWDRADTPLGGSPNVTIAIIDTGVDIDHPDLDDNIYTNQLEADGLPGVDDDGNGYEDDIHGWDFYHGDNDPRPTTDAHGTACAGVAAAEEGNGLGGVGISFRSGILPVKIVSDAGTFASSTAIGNGIRYAADLAQVLSNSWGGGGDDNTIHSAIQYAVNTKGRAVLFASGNDADGTNDSPAWVQYTVSGFLAGTHTFKWEYSKDASVSSGDDTVWLDDVVFPGGEHEGFEDTFPPPGWTTGGMGLVVRAFYDDYPMWDVAMVQGADGLLYLAGQRGWCDAQPCHYFNDVWSIDPATGQMGVGTVPWTQYTESKHVRGTGCHSAQAGAIIDSQTTYLEVTKTVDEGDLVFHAWVSSEENADFFKFYVDGVEYSPFTRSGVPEVYYDVGYPAQYAECIAVGASTDFDIRSQYSQYDETLSNVLDIVAPSNGGYAGITTTDISGAAGYDAADYTSDFGGTSSSTPLAAGVAALMLSKDPTLTPYEVQSVLELTAEEIGCESYDNHYNKYYGHGRINAYIALAATPPIDPPSITRHPESQTLCEYDHAVFSVEATGAPPLDYEWTKNGLPIGDDSSVLTLWNAQATDDGAQIACTVRNAAGSTTSDTATLTVNPLPVITEQPVSQTVCEGGAAIFTVAATGSNLSYQWRKDGVNILGATNESHTVDPVSAGDAGDYDMMVTDDCGPVVSNSATLTVSTGPSITQHPASRTVCEGVPVTFTVSAGGTGTLSYQWRKDGVDITGATNDSYMIPSVGPAHVGAYDCVVDDMCGNAISNPATLTVGVSGPGDLDGDCDVDLDDFDLFKPCLLGPGSGLGSGCDDADLDGEGNVDLQDFAAFQNAFTG